MEKISFKKGKYYLFFLIIINLIIRIPRGIQYGTGFDGFRLLWEAQLLLDGIYFSKGVDLAFLYGLYPASGYPSGSILVVSLLLLISGSNYLTTIYLFNSIFVIILIFSLNTLCKELKFNQLYSFIFILFFTVSPFIYYFTYCTISSRIPFFAICPYFMTLLLKWNRTKKAKYLLFAVFLIPALCLFHRMAMMLLIPILISISIYLFKRVIQTINNKQLFNYDKKYPIKITNMFKYLKERHWIFIFLLSYAVSFIIFPGRWDHNFPEYIDSYISLNFVNKILENQYIADNFSTLYWILTQIGPILLILFVFFLFQLFIPKYRNILDKINKEKQFLYLIYYTIPFTLVVSNYYFIYFFSFALFAIMTISLESHILQFNKSSRKKLLLIILTITSASVILCDHFIIRPINPYPLISIIITIIIILYLIILQVSVYTNFNANNRIYEFVQLVRSKRKKLTICIILLLVVFSNLHMVDRSVYYYHSEYNRRNYITEEVIDIGIFLENIDSRGTFDSFDLQLNPQVALISNWHYIYGFYDVSVFLLSDLELNEIRENRTLIPIRNWFSRSLYETTIIESGILIYSKLMNLDSNSTDAIEIMKKYNMQFFITFVNSSNYLWLDEGERFSTFIESLRSTATTAFVTEHYVVMDLRGLY